MTDPIQRALQKLDDQLPGRLSMPGNLRYAAATAIWPKATGRPPRAVVHCRTPQHIQQAIRAARDAGLAISVRGGGHDWAGRALCDGLVLDLSGMRDVVVSSDLGEARISGGARASDVVAVTDPFGLAPVTGSVGAVGMAGLTLGGGYGPLIGRFGLALDNLLGAEVVLADGRIVTADDDGEAELFWALRGGGGNFGVVTAMRHRLHELAGVRAGVLLFPFSEAAAVLEWCSQLLAFAPDALTAQLGLAFGPDGAPAVMVAPTWCGAPDEGEAHIAPFLQSGTRLMGEVRAMSYGASLANFDAFLVNGQRVLMETAWLPSLDLRSIAALIGAMANAASPGCAVFTHEFRGAASRTPLEATAFGLREDHVLVEILATFDDRDRDAAQKHRRWAEDTRRALEPMALPGGYPNLLAGDDPDRATASYGRNAERLIQAKRRYDPDGVFSAIPLPTDSGLGHARMSAG